MTATVLQFDLERELHSLVDLLGVGVLLEGPDRTIEFVNDEFLRLFGIEASAADLAGGDCAEAARGASQLFCDPGGFLARTDDIVRIGRAVTGDSLQMRDGRTLLRDFSPIKLDRHRRGHVWLYRDWTEEARIARRLEAGEALNRAMLEASLDPVVATDQGGVVIAFNSAAERTFGYQRSFAIGQELATLIVPEEARDAHRAGLERIRAGAHPTATGRRVRVTACRADGTELPVELCIQATGTGQDSVFVGFIRNLSRQDESDRLLQEANSELSRRVDELEAFHAEQLALNELSELLQAARSEKECLSVTCDFLQKVFPDCAGHCFVVSDSPMLEHAFSWGDAELEGQTSIQRDACWGLRRGQRHMVHPSLAVPQCEHTGGSACSLCLPLYIGGEIGGVVSLFTNVVSDDPVACDVARAARILPGFSDRLSFSVTNLRLKHELEEQAVCDALTGLRNRRYFDHELAAAMRRAVDARGPLACLMIDVDRFKDINDTHGHAKGDAVLRAVATALAGSVRSEDLVCRVGGEEFAVLLAGIEGPGALARAETLRRSVESLSLLDDRAITVSVGVACFPTGAADAGELLDAADHALYAAKRQGRNQVVAHSPPVTE